MCDVTSFRSQSFSDSSFLGENVPDLKVNTITTVHSPNTLLRYLCFNLLFQLIQLESDPNDVSVASDLLFSCEKPCDGGTVNIPFCVALHWANLNL